MLPKLGVTGGIVGSIATRVVTNWSSSVSWVGLLDCCQAHMRLPAREGLEENRAVHQIPGTCCYVIQLPCPPPPMSPPRRRRSSRSLSALAGESARRSRPETHQYCTASMSDRLS